jgi:hypothetical protein
MEEYYKPFSGSRFDERMEAARKKYFELKGENRYLKYINGR